MEINDITHAYRVKKTESGIPINVDFPKSPLVTSLDGEIPYKENWNSCILIQFM